MLIRDYTKKDEKDWVRCRVLSFLDTAYYDNVLREKESYENPSIELVAEENGELVGLLDIEFDKEPGQICSSKNEKSGMIWHVAVHPDYQRQGIASQLLAAAEYRLKQQGIHRIEAWTRDDEWVNDWYIKKGFTVGKSYLHVYLEGAEHEGAITSNLTTLTPMYTFAHYTGDNKEELRNKYNRVHECKMYEKWI